MNGDGGMRIQGIWTSDDHELLRVPVRFTTTSKLSHNHTVNLANDRSSPIFSATTNEKGRTKFQIYTRKSKV